MSDRRAGKRGAAEGGVADDACPARGCLGLPVHQSLDLRLPRSDPGTGGRDVRLHLPQPAPQPAAARSLRRPGQLCRPVKRSQGLGGTRGHVAVRSHRAPRRTHRSLRAGHAAEQQVAAGLPLLPGALLHALHHPVCRGAVRVGQHAQSRAGLAERDPRLVRHRRPRLAQRSELDLPRSRRHRAMGHR